MPADGGNSILRVLGAGLALLLVCSAPTSGAEPDATDRQILATRGLVVSGNFAVTRQELMLRKRLDTIDGLIKRVAVAHQQADALLEKNELIRAQLRQVEAGGATPQSQGPSKLTTAADPKGRPPERLQSQMPDVTGLGEQTPLQVALMDWINARSTLQVTVLEIQRSLDALDHDYQVLGADRAVLGSLESMAHVRLGPAKDYRRNNRLAAAKEVFTAAQPVYRESGRWRIGAVLNERVPATLSYAEQTGPTLISSTLAQLVGLEPEPATPAERQRIGDRDLAVRRAKLPALRLGKFVFFDVPVILLPPEAEDLGSQLAGSALAGCRIHLDPQRMTLDLESLALDPARGVLPIANRFSPASGDF